MGPMIAPSDHPVSLESIRIIFHLALVYRGVAIQNYVRFHLIGGLAHPLLRSRQSWDWAEARWRISLVASYLRKSAGFRPVIAQRFAARDFNRTQEFFSIRRLDYEAI